jgi:acetyl-CoA carboxylase biotin carboxyl carrier protein
MTLDDIRHLIELIREHDLSEFELEQEGFRLRVRKGGETVTVQAAPAPAPMVAPPAAPAPIAAAPVVPTEDEGGDLAIVKSPIVGTFYRASEPAAAAFVEVGSPVRKGDVLCIIEAMKLMNEIEAEVAGQIVEIAVANDEPVEFGQTLMWVNPE